MFGLDVMRVSPLDFGDLRDIRQRRCRTITFLIIPARHMIPSNKTAHGATHVGMREHQKRLNPWYSRDQSRAVQGFHLSTPHRIVEAGVSHACDSLEKNDPERHKRVANSGGGYLFFSRLCFLDNEKGTMIVTGLILIWAGGASPCVPMNASRGG